jgi:hypothetical protein
MSNMTYSDTLSPDAVYRQGVPRVARAGCDPGLADRLLPGHGCRSDLDVFVKTTRRTPKSVIDICNKRLRRYIAAVTGKETAP